MLNDVRDYVGRFDVRGYHSFARMVNTAYAKYINSDTVFIRAVLTDELADKVVHEFIKKFKLTEGLFFSFNFDKELNYVRTPQELAHDVDNLDGYTIYITAQTAPLVDIDFLVEALNG